MHNAVDSILDEPQRGAGSAKSYTFTMKVAVSFDAGDEVIMSIAGHVSRQMLSRYSHVRMEPKRRALDEIAARQNVAGRERRKAAKKQHPHEQ